MFFNKKRSTAVIISCLFIVFFLTSLSNNAYHTIVEDFPIPPQTKNMLFYIQRSTNNNTIIYDANIKDGKINSEKALNIYWIRYTEKNQKKDLNYLERTLAYGADAKSTEYDKDVYIIHFAASKKRTATFFLDEGGQAIALMNINGKKSRLNRIFVQAEETSWLPKVKYVDITGSDLQTGVKVVERILP
jgi:hypothetical protein